MPFKLFGSSTVPCRVCKHPVSTDATVCPNCGENLEALKLFGASKTECRNCHETISTDANYCPYCGENQESLKLFGATTTECRSCHQHLSTDAKVCPSCGEDQEKFKLFGTSKQTCPACKFELSADARVCFNCGKDLEKVEFFGSSLMKCPACGHGVSFDATRCPVCSKELDGYTEASAFAQPRRSQYIDKDRNSEKEGSDWLTQIIGGLVAIVLVAWLAVWLISNIILPLVVLDLALILLCTALLQKSYSNYIYPIAFLFGMLGALDYSFGWFNGSFVSFRYISGIVPFVVYLNLVAALTAGYFFVRNLYNSKDDGQTETNEFSQRNLVIMGSFVLLGLTIILGQVLSKENIEDEFASPPVQDNTVTIVAKPFQSNSVAPTEPVVISTIQYTGHVGNLEAKFTLTWFNNATIDGFYYYPSRDNISYVLKGDVLSDNRITLREFTNGVQTATCNLKFDGNCYTGVMNNTDGRVLNMAVCVESAPPVVDSTAHVDSTQEEARGVTPVSADEAVAEIRQEFQRINSVPLTATAVSLGNIGIKYFKENDQVVKILYACSVGSDTIKREYYYKQDTFFFSFSTVRKLDNSMNQEIKEYRVYVRENQTVRYRVNKDVFPCEECTFDQRSFPYRLLQACKNDSFTGIDVCF